MASVQMLKAGGTSNKHYKLITDLLGKNQCTRIDVVFDQYTAKSNKAGKRAKQGASMDLEVKIKGPVTPIPKQWPKYNANPKNKTNLCAFKAERWCQMT